MKFFKIEVDEDVFEYLKGKAEAFVDTPNSVLRRELFRKANDVKVTQKVLSRFPELPQGIPTALQHTLEVIFLVKERGMSRPEATNTVADRHKEKLILLYFTICFKFIFDFVDFLNRD